MPSWSSSKSNPHKRNKHQFSENQFLKHVLSFNSNCWYPGYNRGHYFKLFHTGEICFTQQKFISSSRNLLHTGEVNFTTVGKFISSLWNKFFQTPEINVQKEMTVKLKNQSPVNWLQCQVGFYCIRSVCLMVCILNVHMWHSQCVLTELKTNKSTIYEKKVKTQSSDANKT